MFEKHIPNEIWFRLYNAVHHLKFANVLKEFHFIIKSGKNKELVISEINKINHKTLYHINSRLMWSNRKKELCSPK